MPLASDEDLRTAASLLDPILQLVGSPSLSWHTTSSRDGYTISEISAAPTLGIPLKCFRTQFVVNADVESFAQAIVKEETARRCDPTLKEIRVLGTDRCNTLLYTSYISPSPWLISPREFCVASASVLTSPDQLRRVCPQAPARTLPEYLEGLSGTASEGGTLPSNTVFLQNSRSTTSLLCSPSTDEDGCTYIRGFVHCYGYAAWPSADDRAKLHVTNFCCVDACGRIPQWLVDAAVDTNTQKLKRIASLVEKTMQEQKIKATGIPAPSHSSEKEKVPHQEEPGQASQPFPLPFALSSPQSLKGGYSGDRARSSASTSGALESMSSTFHMQLAMPSEALYDANFAGTQTPGTMMSALTETLSGTPPHSLPPCAHPGIPSTGSTRSSPAPPCAVCLGPSLQQIRHHQEAAGHQTLFNSMVQPLALLARFHGWHPVRETDNVEYAELRSPPMLSKSKDELCVALRVSTTVRCSLDTVEEVLRSPVRAPEIDPELVRLVAAPSPFPHREQRDRQPSNTRGSGVEAASSAPPPHCLTCVATASAIRHSSKTSCQMRHLQFNAEPPFTQSWDMMLCCTEDTLSPHEGGQLGFHTAGVSASTYVWVSCSTSCSGNSTDVCDRGDLGFHMQGFRRMHPRVFGVVAVAIPSSAGAVRVTQYLLFDTPGSSSASYNAAHRSDSRFVVKGKKKTAADFLNAVSVWMGQRLCRLRSLCEDQQLQREQYAMAPLEKAPLLRYLYYIHCTQQVETPHGTPRQVCGVGVRRTELPSADRHDSWTPGQPLVSRPSSSAAPPLYVFSLVFPCSLRHLWRYMSATSARSRYTTDEKIVLYQERASPPGFSSIHLEVCGSEGTCIPPTSFSFLETFGLLSDHVASPPALVLSRLNCDQQQREDGFDNMGQEDDDTSFAAFGGLDGGMRKGRIYCSGWIATELSPAEGGDAVIDDATFSPLPISFSSEGAQRRKALRRLEARARKPFKDSPKSAARGSVEPPGCPTGTSGIVVTQYLCVHLTSPGSRSDVTEDGGLSFSMVEREAFLFARFRDAVCGWRSD
ncbi:hypothetical protein ABL78_5343 [Leptomonas seymouri]|uniref:START domain-containing protein n=1 Tax=Leptomonas seymouri TaxID=5684 RepID=A0A0N1I2B5_LEPSE|nr:hypothetical protein ABL78_5343 [Leptomonas seymouri]|eukprot:KPI85605.1 hypothetical protein ABL78_5343 [Leptomonas seymouri]